MLHGVIENGRIRLVKPPGVDDETWALLKPAIYRNLGRVAAKRAAKRARRPRKTRMDGAVKARLRKMDRDNPWGMARRLKKWLARPGNRERFRAWTRKSVRRLRAQRRGTGIQ